MGKTYPDREIEGGASVIVINIALSVVGVRLDNCYTIKVNRKLGNRSSSPLQRVILTERMVPGLVQSYVICFISHPPLRLYLTRIIICKNKLQG